MKKINFIKMQSLGNDFVIIDNLRKSHKLYKKDIKKISDRHHGVGCDQILVLEKSIKKDIAFHYRIYNKDGTQSGQCGNGAKCVARYYFDNYSKRKKEIKIETITNKMILTNINNNYIKVEMGVPSFNIKDKVSKKNNFTYKGNKLFFESVSIGNPHAVFILKNVETIDLDDFANKFNSKKIFKKGVNISVIQNIRKNIWKARIYERGSGITNACGSAACAISAVAKKNLANSSKDIYIHMKGGKAHVEWSGNSKDPMYLFGESEYIFNGTLEIK
jgi:diaminopimelate epimerase